MHIASNKTLLSRKQLFKLQNIAILKNLWIVAICAVALVILAFDIEEGKIIFSSLAFAILGGTVIPLYVFLVQIICLIKNKKMPPVTTYLFEITDTQISAKAIDQDLVEEVKYNISSMLAYRVDRNYITIAVDKTSSMIMDKRGFENEGEAEKVIALLEEKISNKHKRKNKHNSAAKKNK